MLKNVKATYFCQILFSIIDEKKKLKLVKYNKSLQKIINISISNYIHFKTKYIIYESNKKGKEYDYFAGYLVYEGEYLNGERNGKGIQYYQNRCVAFSGEYSKAKRSGKGKEGKRI